MIEYQGKEVEGIGRRMIEKNRIRRELNRGLRGSSECEESGLLMEILLVQ